MPIEFAERIRRIPVYPAADGYALPGDVALLASNESPYPPIPAVTDAIARSLTGLNRYPDPTNAALRKALSDRNGVPAARGSRSATGPATSCSPPARRCSSRTPSSSTRGPASASTRTSQRRPARARSRSRSTTTHTHDLDAMLREITAATRLVLVCNPNNPTSTALPLEEIAAFVRAVPRHIAVILDEAYCEFNLLQDPDESIALLDRHPNLVLLRTFSKVYGLCGLRVGYGLCGSEAFRNAVDQVRQPFYCNAAAQAAAVEALKHQDEVTRRVERNLAERMDLAAGLRGIGLAPAESQANFVWFDLPDAEASATSSPASPSAACSCAPARRSAAPARSASRSAPRPRTRSSSPRSASSSAERSSDVTRRRRRPARPFALLWPRELRALKRCTDGGEESAVLCIGTDLGRVEHRMASDPPRVPEARRRL